jgi:hypothetical protein
LILRSRTLLINIVLLIKHNGSVIPYTVASLNYNPNILASATSIPDFYNLKTVKKSDDFYNNTKIDNLFSEGESLLNLMRKNDFKIDGQQINCANISSVLFNIELVEHVYS